MGRRQEGEAPPPWRQPSPLRNWCWASPRRGAGSARAASLQPGGAGAAGGVGGCGPASDLQPGTSPAPSLPPPPDPSAPGRCWGTPCTFSTGSKNPCASRVRAGDRTGSPVQPQSHTSPARRPARIPPALGPPPRAPALAKVTAAVLRAWAWPQQCPSLLVRNTELVSQGWPAPWAPSRGQLPALAGVCLPSCLFAPQGAEGSQEAVRDRDGTCSLGGAATGP